MTSKNKSIHNREFETIFESSEDPIYIIDENGKILKMNNACLRFYGYSQNEIIGENLKTLKDFFSSSTVLNALKYGKRIAKWENTDSNREFIITATPVFSDQKKVERIVCTIKDVTELLKLKSEMTEAKRKIKQYEVENTEIPSEEKGKQIILKNRNIKRVFAIGKRVANVDSTVLILGESGVGKNVLAKYIHDNSSRRKGSYVEINCGAISETLLESELFGYEPGAFTGAKRSGRKGHIEMANKGTIFLDEIGEMTKALQVKLLHFLQSKTIIKVGSTNPVNVDVRVIAATNQNIEMMIKNGDFREDLYYRLNVVPIKLPPLRDRKEDVQPLIKYFLELFQEKYNLNKELKPRVINKLLEYSWPGNVRELQNVIERLVVVSEDNTVDLEDLPENILNTSKGILDGEEIEANKIISFYNRYQSTYKAAEALGMSQSTFFRKLRRYQKNV